MKRDMDLVRQILIAIEETPDDSVDLNFEEYEEELINYHVGLLVEAGLIKGLGTQATDTTYWSPERLTWAGHEFLDAARNETVWNSAKNLVKEKGGSIPFDVLKDLLLKLTAASIGLV